MIFFENWMIFLDDFVLMKEFNKRNIKIAFKKLTKLTSVKEFIYTDYNKIGIFLDIRCNCTDSILSVFSEVFD